jgi:hypothetical protein
MVDTRRLMTFVVIVLILGFGMPAAITGASATTESIDLSCPDGRQATTTTHRYQVRPSVAHLEPVLVPAGQGDLKDRHSIRRHRDVVVLFAPGRGTPLPKLGSGYHYRTVGRQVQVVRNPGRVADLPAMHFTPEGKLKFGPGPGAPRSTATRTAFLKQLDASMYPKWMRADLARGKVPVGFEVDHFKALFDDGMDVIPNMRVVPIDLHKIRHRFYRPSGRIPTINPPGS